MPQHSFKPLLPLSTSDGTCYPSLPGTTLAELSRFAAPTLPEIGEMLAELRGQPGWSQGLTSAVLGVPVISCRQWERHWNPTAAGRKLIWLLHQALILKNTLDPIRIATWGKLDGIPLAKLERLIRRTTAPVAEPEHGQGEAGRRRQGKDRPPVSRGRGGGPRAQGDGVTRNSTEISDGAGKADNLATGTGVSENRDICPREEVGFSGKVSEDKVRLANPRKVQVVLGHGRIYRRVKRRTERARKKELGKAYKRVKYEIPEGIKDGDDSWKWG